MKIPEPATVGIAMEHEPNFGSGGHYGLVVRNNLLGHREAVEWAKSAFAEWARRHPPKEVVMVLDLACGGEPVTCCQVISRFPEYRFKYIGIDIHDDQVSAARHFDGYPANIESITIIKGNGWTPTDFGFCDSFDLIYSGLNFHHATPEEIYFLARQLRKLLSPNGLVLNHDLYRPSGMGYLRRPSVIPSHPAEPTNLVPPNALLSSNIPSLDVAGEVYGSHSIDWRDNFLELYERALADTGVPASGIREIIDHVRQRDFPLSMSEMMRVWTIAGYKVEMHDLAQSSLQLREYLGLMQAALGRA